jgi:hypothetical protein
VDASRVGAEHQVAVAPTLAHLHRVPLTATGRRDDAASVEGHSKAVQLVTPAACSALMSGASFAALSSASARRASRVAWRAAGGKLLARPDISLTAARRVIGDEAAALTKRAYPGQGSAPSPDPLGTEEPAKLSVNVYRRCPFVRGLPRYLLRPTRCASPSALAPASRTARATPARYGSSPNSIECGRTGGAGSLPRIDDHASR